MMESRYLELSDRMWTKDGKQRKTVGQKVACLGKKAQEQYRAVEYIGHDVEVDGCTRVLRSCTIVTDLTL